MITITPQGPNHHHRDMEEFLFLLNTYGLKIIFLGGTELVPTARVFSAIPQIFAAVYALENTKLKSISLATAHQYLIGKDRIC